MPLIDSISPATEDIINQCLFGSVTVVNLVFILPWVVRKLETLPESQAELRGPCRRVLFFSILSFIATSIYFFHRYA